MHFIIILAAALSILCTPVTLKAQVNVNINTQPPWGPTGYDYVEYYYLPDIEVYYNVPSKRYYYYDGNKWKYTSNLPSRYNYNYYHSYKVVINEREPWTKHKNHKNKYASYKNRVTSLLSETARMLNISGIKIIHSIINRIIAAVKIRTVIVIKEKGKNSTTFFSF
jgi:hypothetical protein